MMARNQYQFSHMTIIEQNFIGLLPTAAGAAAPFFFFSFPPSASAPPPWFEI